MLGVLNACGSGAPVDQPAVNPPDRELSLQFDAPSSAALQVVSVSPEGPQTDNAVQLNVVFNKPVRAADLAENEQPPPISITPPISGKWAWVGTGAVTFIPDPNAVHSATLYTVTVPQSITAIDGTALQSARSFEFETPRPAVVNLGPEKDESPLTPGSRWIVDFNLPVTPKALAPLLHVSVQPEGGAKSAIEVDIQRSPAQPERLVVIPRSPLPLASKIEVKVDAGLQTEAGPLLGSDAFNVAFETYHKLEVRFDCDAGETLCNAPPRVTFNNPIPKRGVAGKISVTPLPGFRVVPSYSDPPDAFALQGNYTRHGHYRVVVSAGITDIYGQKLQQRFQRDFEMGEGEPMLEVAAAAGFIESALGASLKVGSLNLADYELMWLPLSPEQMQRHLQSGNERLSQAEFRSERVSSALGLNRQYTHSVALSALLATPGHSPTGGAVAISARSPRIESAYENQFRIIHPTDLAVTAIRSAVGGAAWVTRLSDGRPVADAKLRVLGLSSKVDGLVTDDQGLALLPRFGTEADVQGRAPILVAETANDWAYARLEGASEYEPRVLFSLATERDLYRPGEQVHVKGWLRREQSLGSSALGGVNVAVRLQDDERIDHEVKTKSNAFGGFDAVLDVPKAARIGRHAIVAVTDDGESQESIRVGEYRPTEFNAEVSCARQEVLPHEAIAARLSGSYLFGAPMSGMAVSYFGVPAQTSVQPPGTEGYQTDAWEQHAALKQKLGLSELGATSSVETLLDAGGQAQAELKPRFDMLGPIQFTFTATVQDATRQAVSAGDITTIQPGEFYLAIAVPEGDYTPKQKVGPKILAVKPNGERVAGQRVRVEFYRQPWDYHWSANTKSELVGHCDVVSAKDPVSCSVQPKVGGAYFALARATDRLGNPIYASSSFYVSGWSYGAASEEVKVTLDKEQYRVGSTARVTVATPIPDADVLLTLEQASVLWSKTQRAKGRFAQFEVPVTENFGANVEVVAYVARPSKLTKANLAEASRPWNVGPELLRDRISLQVDQSWRHLQVKVTPEQTTTLPGSSVKVRLEVYDGLGRPHAAELAVAAVDEGVLSLTAHQSQDPFNAFTAFRPSVVGYVDSRTDMGWLYQPAIEPNEFWGIGQGFGAGHGRLGGSHSSRAPMVRMGKAMIGAAADPRGDFRTTPYWNPSVVTDAQGKAEVNVSLSQLLTRFRISAAAVAKDDFFGGGQSAIETQKPLMARPALPRFLRVGDRFTAGVVVSSVGFTSPSVRVQVKATGVELDGPAQKTQPIAAGESKEVRFEFRATAPGEASFDFQIDAGDAKDRVIVNLPVELSVTPQAVALYGKTDAAQAEVIGSLSGASAVFGGLSISTASTALVGLGDGMRQLIDYPYGCTEQLSSRLLPLLPLRQLAKDFGVELPEDLDETIQSTVDKIVARQRYDGGFGLWDNDPESHAWLSAYVYGTLQQAQVRAVRVPAETLSQALEYLHGYLEQARDEYYRPTAALIAHVLAQAGNPSQATIGPLLVDSPGDVLFVRALILDTLALAKPILGKDEAWRKQAEARMSELRKQIESKIRLSSNRAFVEADGDLYSWLFDSTTRTDAMVLSALLNDNPKHPLAERLARGLLEARRGGAWRSTQETAYALLALENYRKKQEAAVPNFEAVISFGKQELGRSQHHGRSFDTKAMFLPMSALPRQGSRLTFEKRGEGTLFYQALLRYSPDVPPRAPLDHGFVVSQGLHTVTRGDLPAAVEQGIAPSETRFGAGSVVLGQILVTTPTARDYVVIEAPLPAGLEAIDTELAINSREGLDDDGEQRPRRFMPGPWAQAWSRRELRDDRVLFFINHMPPGAYRYRYFARATSAGHFVLPPVTTQEMYAPENFGRNGALEVEVH